MVDRKTGLKPKAKSPKPKAISEKADKSQKPLVSSKTKDVELQDLDLATTDSQLEAKVTKAGKHSAKGHREAEEKQAKETRKSSARAEDVKPKTAQKPARSREERAGKKYREAAKQIDKSKSYSQAEAIELATKTSPTKFDATVELHINLAVDPKQADQNIRGTVSLPSGTGKDMRVAVADEALLAKLDKGEIDFDVLVAAPDFMPKLGKYAKLLGPRGLMPNPKSGTVTTDTATAVTEAKAGKLEYRVDSAGILHMPIGKVSFGAQKIGANLDAVLSSVRVAKPASVKGIFIKSAYLTTSMGPSIKLEI